MLINFSVENFRSFRDRVDFTSIAAPRKKLHGDHIIKIKYGLRILPVAAFFGANASGKSNLVQAMAIAGNLITEGKKPDEKLPYIPFHLNRLNPNKPTSFSFDLFIDAEIYNYRFSIDSEKIVTEALSLVREKTEITLFSRNECNEIDLLHYKRILPKEDYDFLKHVAKGTRPNQLFLTESIERNVPHFINIHEWFKESLVVFGPKDQVTNFIELLSNHQARSFFNSMLRGLDTGIDQLVVETKRLSQTDIPEMIIDQFIKKGSGAVHSLWNDAGSKFEVREEDGEFHISELLARHGIEEGTHKVDFRMSEESDGTRRLIDLLPAFLRLIHQQSPVTFVIDEIDRSMHSHLTRKLIEEFLSSRGENPGYQLLFTTHDTTILDQDLLRQDEIWILERKDDGATELSSLSDFENTRYDLDIRKRYLQGRFGGVPYIAENPARYGEAKENG